MEYLKVSWDHDLSEPVVLYSELDECRMEIRKIEVYRDGHADTADRGHRTGSTKLSIEPLPSVEEIASDPQFVPKVISKVEFDELWGSSRKAAS